MTTTYRPEYLPTIRDIHETFLDEITSLGGVVSDVYNDGQRVFARAVLPNDAEIRPGDAVNAGVALRAAGPEILVHPYVFRQVCTNGAIMAHSFQSQRLERIESTEVFLPTFGIISTLAELRRAIGACAARKAFSVAAGAMRSATEVQSDIALHLLPLLRRLPNEMVGYAIREIFREFNDTDDRSAYGLMNAVTAVARDARDPETAWRLEVLGGELPAHPGVRASTVSHRSTAGVA